MLPRTDTVLSLLPLRRACLDHGAAVRILDSLSQSALLSHFCLSSCSPIVVVWNFLCCRAFSFDSLVAWIPTDYRPRSWTDHQGYHFFFFYGLIYSFDLFCSQLFLYLFRRAPFISIPNIATVLFHKRRFQLLGRRAHHLFYVCPFLDGGWGASPPESYFFFLEDRLYGS